jgi:hypothetical protein
MFALVGRPKIRSCVRTRVLIPKAHVVMQPNLQCLFPNEAFTEQSALILNAGASFRRPPGLFVRTTLL